MPKEREVFVWVLCQLVRLTVVFNYLYTSYAAMV